MKKKTGSQVFPLQHARTALVRARKTARLGLVLPVPTITLATGGLFAANLLLFQNAFLTLFLGIIFAVFVAGQIVSLAQLSHLRPTLASAEKTLKVLLESGEDPDLESLKRDLEEKVPEGTLRDLVLRWTELGIRGNAEGYETLLENSLDRSAIRDNRMLSLHATINRTTLKLGFLGTLIGIILTFPPMKRAVLGLSDSDGELKFIRDIALAIDGDQYAILSTLIATGLSILVEFVTIQLLERVLLGLEVVQSNVNDWNTVCLQPAIARRRDGAARAADLEKTRHRMELALAQAQQILEKHLTDLTAAMRDAGGQLNRVVEIQAAVGRRLEDLAGYEKLAGAMAESQQALERHLAEMTDALRTSTLQMGQITDAQSLLGRRVSELAEYEKQYRRFLASKQRAAAPDGLRGEP